jgi:pilus assembly protein Flp/PilA
MSSKIAVVAARVYGALANLGKDKKGVTAVEYGVIAALIIVVCIVAITTIGTNLNTTFSTVGSAVAR